MKKLFTLAAGALIGLSASLPAEAFTLPPYKKGAAIESQSQLTTGKYFIYAYSKGVGKFVHYVPADSPTSQDTGFMGQKGLAEISADGITDGTYIYTITVNDGTFNITANTGETFSVNGNGGEGKGNTRPYQANHFAAAEFTLTADEVTGQGDFADPLFFVAPQGVMCVTPEATAQTYICTNGTGDSGTLGYWSGTRSVGEAGNHETALAFYPVTAEVETDLTAEGQYFLIKNVRKGKYAQAHTSDGAKLSQIDTNTLNATSGRYDLGSLWSFMADDNAAAVDGYTAVKICNPMRPNLKLASVDPETWTTDGITWYISNTTSTKSGTSGFTISKKAVLNTDDDNAWNDFGGGGTTVGYWRTDDDGSKWLLELPEEGKVTATLEELDTEAHEKFAALKTQGDLIAAMAGLPAERATAWTTATESLTTYSSQNLESLKTAYGILVDGLHMTFNTHQHPDDYMCQNGGNPWCYGSEGNGSRIFTLKNAAGEGFYLLNEYTQKYLVHPTADDVNATFNADANHASIYNIDMHEAATDNAQSYYGIFTISEGIPSDRTYLNTNGNHQIYRSQKENNSSWRVTFTTEDEAATEDLERAKNPTGYTIGTGLGQYHYTEAFTTARANADAATTAEEKRAAATALRSITPFAINQPEPGRFYRFHYGDKYLSSTLSGNRFAIVAKSVDSWGNDNLNNTTVFYYDGDHLVTYPDGEVMGNLRYQKESNGSYSSVLLSNVTYAGYIDFVASSHEIGKYCIKFPVGENYNDPAEVLDRAKSDRYLYHRDSQIDAGDSENQETGYRWEITEVTWLPIPVVDVTKKHFSVCVPVDLNITADRAEAHTGVIQDSNFGLQAIEGTTLPANTPAVLEYKGGVSNNCVYFEITGYPEIATAAEATNDLTNTGVYAAAKEEGQSYFTVDNESFVPAGDTLPAFAAILKVPTGQANEAGYAITEYKDPTSITEIEGAVNSGKQVIYDLQGRRVQRAGKGLYIINGVKTLVK